MAVGRVVNAVIILAAALFVVSVEVHYSPISLAISPALAVLVAWAASAWMSRGERGWSLGPADVLGLIGGGAIAYMVSPLLGAALAAVAGHKPWMEGGASLKRGERGSPDGGVGEASRECGVPALPRGFESLLVVGPDLRASARVAFRVAAAAAASPLRVVLVDTVGVAREELDELDSPYVEVDPEELDLVSPTARPEHYLKAASILSSACGGNAAAIESALRNRSLDSLARDLTSPSDLRTLARSFSGGVRVSIIDAMPRFGALVVDLSTLEPVTVRESAAILAAMQGLSTDYPSFLVATALSASVSRDADRRLRAELIDLLSKMSERGLILAVDSSADAKIWDAFPVLVLCPGIRASWQSQVLGGLRLLDRDSLRELKRLEGDEVLVVWGSPPRRARVKLRDISPQASRRG